MKPMAIALLLLLTPISVIAEEATILELVGPTMGTRFTVKVFAPEAMDMSAEDAQIRVDGLLRAVNDQMSTYLPSSEISRFNQSESLEWYDVSSGFAEVVAYALSVAEKTDGALDITVEPLVNAWNFGPAARTSDPPGDAQIEQLRQWVGFEKLAVRLDPPALKKTHPKLEIDLSSIAKGYAADEVVRMLAEHGADNVFVEIGGEVRTAGNKAGQWWKVGIQLPDAVSDTVMIAHALSTGGDDDQAMATSGDYRNFFESDGVRYSHTLDPATGRPVTHALASVSVVAGSCMAADAWATAMNVLGAERGKLIAEREKLNVLLVSRQADGFAIDGTGTLAGYASTGEETQIAAEEAGQEKDSGNLFAVLLVTFVAFAVVLFGMAVGVMFGRRSISGSCGGLANAKNQDGSVSCSLCSNPADACKELRQRMQESK
ncbi:MAG: FAD:protein FMN transferase [Rubripirellula sp.]|nr:FAD:protein FMN transferase [Rubripirellula sp.]